MNQQDDTVAVRAVVHGRVQGVGYRWSTVQQAERLGLAGWVRNLADGTVELWAQGSQQSVDELLRWCHQGPGYAEVTRVDTSPVSPDDLHGFRVR